MRIFGQSLTAAALLLASGTAADAQARKDDSVAIAVDAGKPGPKIDRNIFGQFAEHLGTGIYGGVWVGKDSPIPNVRGIRKDVVAALRAIKVPNVRWPGGCFADEYHWRHGIGPAKDRHNTINSNWGGAVEPNTLRHGRVLRFRRADRQRGLCFGQCRLGHRRGGGRLARLYDRRSDDDGRQGAGRQRAPCPL